MSVRTAWEIAALEDVRLAPSPRQQQPAPARVCGGLCLTPPGPSLGPRRCRQGRGTPQRGAHPLSARLFCSWSALPTPLVGHKWAGAWVSLVPPGSHPWPWGTPRQELGRLPHRGAGLGPLWELPLLPQPYEAEEALSAPGVGDSTGRGARAEWPTCTPSWACALGRALR